MQLGFPIASEFIIGHVFHVHKFFNLIKKLIMMLADPVFNLKDVIVLILNKIAKKRLTLIIMLISPPLKFVNVSFFN